MVVTMLVKVEVNRVFVVMDSVSVDGKVVDAV